jgi:hypothetical protein
VHVWTKAGVMIRENLGADATNASPLSRPPDAWARSGAWTTFGATVSTRSENEGEIALPYWVRLTRTGNMFKGEQSADGVTWSPCSSRDTRPARPSGKSS